VHCGCAVDVSRWNLQRHALDLDIRELHVT
jgi:hypothetical protein